MLDLRIPDPIDGVEIDLLVDLPIEFRQESVSHRKIESSGSTPVAVEIPRPMQAVCPLIWAHRLGALLSESQDAILDLPVPMHMVPRDKNGLDEEAGEGEKPVAGMRHSRHHRGETRIVFIEAAFPKPGGLGNAKLVERTSKWVESERAANPIPRRSPKMSTTRSHIRGDEHGVWRVGNTRVMLDSVVAAYHQGHSAETIARQYPALSLEEVYGAITYYLANKSEVDQDLRRQDEVWKPWREKPNSGTSPVVQRLRSQAGRVEVDAP